PAGQAALDRAAAQINQLRPDMPADELTDWLRVTSGFDLEVEDEAPSPAARPQNGLLREQDVIRSPISPLPAPAQPHKKGGGLLRASLWLNLLLIAAIIALILWPRGS